LQVFSTQYTVLRIYIFKQNKNSILGLQVYPFQLKHWSAIGRQIWSLIINLCVISGHYLGDAFLQEHNGPTTALFSKYSHKPLVRLLMQINAHYNYPISYPLLSIYFCTFGPRIASLLESPHFTHAYASSV